MKKLILSSAMILFMGLAVVAQDGTKDKKCEKKCDPKECTTKDGKKCDPKDCTADMGCKDKAGKSCAHNCAKDDKKGTKETK